MKTAYVETLSTGEILVEVQVKAKKRTESFFHSFKDQTELANFKKESTDTHFISLDRKMTDEQIAKAVKLTIDDYSKVRTDEFLIEAYKDSQESITVEALAENNLDFNMNDIEYSKEDLKEVIRLAKVSIEE